MGKIRENLTELDDVLDNGVNIAKMARTMFVELKTICNKNKDDCINCALSSLGLDCSGFSDDKFYQGCLNEIDDFLEKV